MPSWSRTGDLIAVFSWSKCPRKRACMGSLVLVGHRLAAPWVQCCAELSICTRKTRTACLFIEPSPRSVKDFGLQRLAGVLNEVNAISARIDRVMAFGEGCVSVIIAHLTSPLTYLSSHPPPRNKANRKESFCTCSANSQAKCPNINH